MPIDKLPVEILTEIIKSTACLDGTDTGREKQMYDLCLCCKAFYPVAVAILYASVNYSPGEDILLQRTIRTNQRLAALVKMVTASWHTFSISTDTISKWYSWRLSHFIGVFGPCRNLEHLFFYVISYDSAPGLNFIALDFAFAPSWTSTVSAFQSVRDLSINLTCSAEETSQLTNGLALLSLLPNVCELWINTPEIAILLSRPLPPPGSAIACLEPRQGTKGLLDSLAYDFGFIVDKITSLAHEWEENTSLIHHFSPLWRTANELVLYTDLSRVTEDCLRMFNTAPNLCILSLQYLPVTDILFNTLSTSVGSTLVKLEFSAYRWFRKEDDWAILFSPAFPKLRTFNCTDTNNLFHTSVTNRPFQVPQPSIIRLSQRKPHLQCHFSLGLRYNEDEQAQWMGVARFMLKAGALKPDDTKGDCLTWRRDFSLSDEEKLGMLKRAKQRLGWVEEVQEAAAGGAAS